MPNNNNKESTPMPLKDTALFSPIRVGAVKLSNRVVAAPLTRLRNSENVPGPLLEEYYDQRSQYKGSLVIAEGTYVSAQGGGLSSGPGIWSKEQVEAWRVVFDRIHKNDSFVFLQIYAMGRQANASFLKSQGFKLVGASDDLYIDEASQKDALDAGNPVVGLSIDEISQYVKDHVQAAKNALYAGADGVEFHVANGYLLNEFLDPASNHRQDKYGGSIENRARFALEIVDALIQAIGSEKFGIRISPFGIFGGMSGVDDPTLIAQYAYLVGELEKRARAGHRLAYIHTVEPRAILSGTTDDDEPVDASNDFLYSIWKGVIIRAGDYAMNPHIAKDHVSLPRTLIAYGRFFISNPDLHERVYNGYSLSSYDRDTFYTEGAAGYTDYPRHQN